MPPHDPAALLERLAQGDHAAAGEFLPLVYAQLRSTAQRLLNGERQGHTLQATALMHEACAKLLGGSIPHFANLAHFYDAAARAMRQVLIDHARLRNAVKRGRGIAATSL